MFPPLHVEAHITICWVSLGNPLLWCHTWKWGVGTLQLLINKLFTKFDLKMITKKQNCMATLKMNVLGILSQIIRLQFYCFPLVYRWEISTHKKKKLGHSQHMYRSSLHVWRFDFNKIKHIYCLFKINFILQMQQSLHTHPITLSFNKYKACYVYLGVFN